MNIIKSRGSKIACRCWQPLLVLCAGVALALGADKPTVPPLSSVANSPRLPGKFVWADLVTDDVQAARTFYTGMFGWSFREVGTYSIAYNEDRPLCGIFHRSRPADRPEARPRWISYLSVRSVSAAERTVNKAGGRVVSPPQNIPKRGDQAVFADTEGALFGVICSRNGDPEDFLPEPGDWIWIQLFSHDAQKAAGFYRNIGGYEVMENTATNRLSDYILTSEGFARATIRTISKQYQQVPANWLPFVRVNHVAESVAKAKQLGGTALVEPSPGLFDGKVAVIADPTGGLIGILEWSALAGKGAR
jgi:predicted enzyme related to lactoylglutathione lyase